jgi:hypothetical protein
VTTHQEVYAVGSDTQDPFATTGDQDPFATAPAAAPASAIDPPDEDGPSGTAPQAEAEPPVVDREGQPVNGETAVEAQPPEAVPATPEEAAAQPDATPVPDEPQEGAQGAQEPQAAAVEAPEAPAPETAPADGDGGQPPAPPAAPPATEEPGLPEGVQGTASSATVQPAAAASGDEVETAPEDGKSPWRHYALLYQTGPGQWTEYDLTTVSDDLKQYTERKPLDDKKPDAETFVFLKARNADHARRVAWVIFGRPEAGVTVNPVARSSWKPKRLQKAPPAPERERLVIS